MIGQSKNKESTLEIIFQSVIGKSTHSVAPSASAGGATDNSPRFQPWVSRIKIPKPRQWRQKKAREKNSFVPAGLGSFPFYPQLKLRAIFVRRVAAENKKGVHRWTPSQFCLKNFTRFRHSFS
jgi:hypothetical protein